MSAELGALGAPGREGIDQSQPPLAASEMVPTCLLGCWLFPLASPWPLQSTAPDEGSILQVLPLSQAGKVRFETWLWSREVDVNFPKSNEMN